jgi:hypothetical protein
MLEATTRPAAVARRLAILLCSDRPRLATQDRPRGHGLGLISRCRHYALARGDLIERGAESVAFEFEVAACLQVRPEPLGGPDLPRQAQRGGVGGDAPGSMDDLVDSARPDTDRDGERVLGATEG